MSETTETLPREIVLLEQAAGFLAECQSLDEVKSIRDKAQAIRLYQRKIDGSRRSKNALAEIVLRAERRMGELLRAMPKDRGGGDVRNHRSHRATGAPKLQAIGVNRTESSRCQAIAWVPKQDFEQTIAKAKETNGELTSKEMVKKGRTHQRKESRMERLRTAQRLPEDPAAPRSWQIIHGHCTTVMGHPKYRTPPYEARQSPAITGVRLIFADPPYNEGVDYGTHYDDDQDADAYRNAAADWIVCCLHALADDGSLWLLVSHEWAWRLCGVAIGAGFKLRQWITWYESFGVNCTGKFNRCSRSLLWLVKDEQRFVFHPEAVTRPSDRQVKYRDHRADPEGKRWDDVWGINPPIPRLTGTCAERLPDFPTQLPLALLRPIVACASDPGDLVLDPFSGSATTGVACIESGRRYIGIELGPHFVELSEQRLSAAGPVHA